MLSFYCFGIYFLVFCMCSYRVVTCFAVQFALYHGSLFVVLTGAGDETRGVDEAIRRRD